MAEERRHDEEPQEGKGKNGKKEKPPKEKKEKKGKKQDNTDGGEESSKGKKEKKEKPEKEKKEKKHHPVMMTLLSTSLFWLALLLVATIFTYYNFDLFGVFDEGMKEFVLQKLNPEEDFEIVFESELQTWKDYETELDTRSAELEEYSFELDTREEELSERESQLEDLQSELEEKFPNVFDEDAQDNVNLTDILDVAKAVAEMTPKNAADAMLGMSQEVAILILNSMKPAQRGAILDQMPADEAASIIEAMASPE